MKPKIDYSLLIQCEKIRYQSDFSSAHWLHQVISKYESGLRPKVAETYEIILRTAIYSGVKNAIEKSKEYPLFLGFPSYIELDNSEWDKTKQWAADNMEFHLKNRFGYLRDGD